MIVETWHRHRADRPIASPPPEPIGSAMSYDADLVRASRLMPSTRMPTTPPALV